MKQSRVNMRDVAAKAGVTPTTVSLVLRNDSRISEATKEKVLKIADEMGYRPNPMVAALMSQVQSGKRVENSTKLALVGPKGNHEWSMNSQFTYPRRVIMAMRERAEELGYSGIDVFEPETENSPLEQLVKVISYRGIKGVLLSPFVDEGIHMDFNFQFSDFAVVAAGYSQQIRGIHRVAHNQYQIAFQITEKLLERGYRRIGMALSSEFEKRIGWHYTGGFMGAIQLNKKAWLNRKAILYYDDILPGKRDEQFADWIKNNRLECIMTQDPGDYKRLVDMGLRIPEDLGFAMLTYPDEWHRPVPEPSGMFHNPAELGRAAVDLVTAQISRNEYGLPPFPKTVLTRPKWMEGTTIRSAN